MSRSLPLLLSLLLLVAAACSKKKDPEPDKPATDSLEGRWRVQTTRTRTYAADGTLLFDGVPTVNSYSYEFITATTLQSYRDLNTSAGPPYTYTRQGNVLTIDATKKVTILRLVANELELEYETLTPNPTPPSRTTRLLVNETYTRVL